MKRHTNIAEEIESNFVRDTSNLMVATAVCIMVAACAVIFLAVWVTESLMILDVWGA